MLAFEYIDYNKVVSWAYNTYGLTIVSYKSPYAYSYMGQNLVCVPDHDDLFYEIGRYCVASAYRRRMANYNLHTYSYEQKQYILKHKLLNGNIIEHYRALTYAYYLHGWFNYKLYKWARREGFSDDIFNLREPTYNIKDNVDWLHTNKILDNFVPTGKLFNGYHDLGNPLTILKGIHE